jgi:hypothetical protein
MVGYDNEKIPISTLKELTGNVFITISPKI